MTDSQNWYEIKETSGAGWGLRIMFVLLKFTPAFFMRLLAFPVGFFYWIFSKKARMISKEFLIHERSFSGRKQKFSTLRHIICFALNLVENIQGWGKKFSFKNVTWQNDDVTDLVKNINAGKGVLLLISHTGNAQMLRALAAENEAGVDRPMSVTSFTDTNLNASFSRIIQKVNSQSAFHLMSTRDIGPETIFILQERLEKGEVVVIAGDRISANTNRYIFNDFMGRQARFPYGVYLLASLLNVPVYFVCGMRHKDLSLSPRYDMYVTKCSTDFNCTRKEREDRMKECCSQFAGELERFVSIHPCQWYNFYDFWACSES